MSEYLAAAAAAVGGPEELVMRSARARAAATGATPEAILQAWAGGEAAPAAAAPPAEATPAAEPAPQPTPEPVASAPVDTVAPAAPAAPPPPETITVHKAPSDAAPLLVGRTERPMLTLAGIVALFVLGALFAVGLPALEARSVAAAQVPGTTPELSALAIDGHAVYVREGCAECHTRQVRTVVTDVGLGPVTEPGTSPAVGPSVLGYQRIGPDLTHVGSREMTDEAAELEALLVDPAAANPESIMPSYGYLSGEDLAALVQFLVESK